MINIAYGITIPLLTNSAGEKIGKSTSIVNQQVRAYANLYGLEFLQKLDKINDDMAG